MTAKDFAAAIKRPYPTVALWLRDNLIPEVTSIQLGDMRVWQIPLSALETFEPPKIGRPRKETPKAEPKKGWKKKATLREK